MNKVFYNYISREYWDVMTGDEKKDFIQKKILDSYVADSLSVKTVVEYDLDMVSVTVIVENEYDE